MNREYTPTITRDHPLLAASTYGGEVHAWFESIGRRGGPTGSRSLCGKRSRGWCVKWDGFGFDGPKSIEDAERVSYFGSMCPECRDRLGTDQ